MICRTVCNAQGDGLVHLFECRGLVVVVCVLIISV